MTSYQNDGIQAEDLDWDLIPSTPPVAHRSELIQADEYWPTRHETPPLPAPRGHGAQVSVFVQPKSTTPSDIGLALPIMWGYGLVVIARAISGWLGRHIPDSGARVLIAMLLGLLVIGWAITFAALAPWSWRLIALAVLVLPVNLAVFAVGASAPRPFR